MGPILEGLRSDYRGDGIRREREERGR